MRAVILLKPDCFQRRIWGRAFCWMQEETDIEITQMDMVYPTSAIRERLEAHYAEHVGKPFYPGLIDFMTSGPIGVLLVETESIPQVRQAVQRFRDSWHSRGAANLLHCSDSPEAGDREATIWFPSL